MNQLYKNWSPSKWTTVLEERNLNPELNTANLDLHKMRLSKFQKSKYYSTMYYMGKKGGIYTVSYNGNKVYKQI